MTATATAARQLPPRYARTIAHVQPLQGRGLEIGPLAQPMVTKAEGDVYYLDMFDTDALRAHYGPDPAVITEDIVEVDFPMLQDGVVRSLAQAAAPGAPYDWAVASHVVEHVPDLIGFLSEIGSLLKPGGRLALAVPDRRFCFDARRTPTTIGQILQAHECQDRRPSVRAVFDHFSGMIHFDPAELWRGNVPGPDAHLYTMTDIRNILERYRSTGDYIDSHVWLFTPATFVSQLRMLTELGLLDYTVEHIEPTPFNDLEFFVTLQRMPDNLTATQRERLIETGFPHLEDEPVPAPPAVTESEAVPVETAPVETVVPTEPRLVLTAREERLIELKRRALNRLRRVRLRR